MGQAVGQTVLDAALAEVATATRLSLCSAEPANFAGIAAVQLGSVSLTAGAGNGDFTLGDGDASARKMTAPGQDPVSVSTTGTATHVVLDDGTDLVYVTTCPSIALTSGGDAVVSAWDVEFGDPGASWEFTNLAGLGLTLQTQHECDTKHPTGWDEFDGNVDGATPATPSPASQIVSGGPLDNYIRFTCENLEDSWTSRYMRFFPGATQVACGVVMRADWEAEVDALSYFKGVSARIDNGSEEADNWFGFAPVGNPTRTTEQNRRIRAVQFTNFTGTEADYDPDLNTPHEEIDMGSWFKLEWFIDLDNERVRWWLNGTLIGDSDLGGGGWTFDNLELLPGSSIPEVKVPQITLGGGSGIGFPTPLTAASYFDVARCYIYHN